MQAPASPFLETVILTVAWEEFQHEFGREYWNCVSGQA
jgi:hypothetical protein